MSERIEAARDWWKPDPEDPFWMLENEGGEWLKNEHTQLTTRDPVKAKRYPSHWHADSARRALVGMGWALFRPTEHLWLGSRDSAVLTKSTGVA